MRTRSRPSARRMRRRSSHPFYGEGLDGLMRARSNDLFGIVNGLDYDDS